MDVQLPKKLTAALASVALAATLSPAVGLQQAEAAQPELQAASLTAQAAPGNSTMYHAQKLKSGKSVIGTFESKDDSNDNLYDYWYKFKTSGRWSVYSVKLESIDGRKITIRSYNSDGDEIYGWPGGWGADTSTAVAGYKTDCSRNAWYYFNVDRGYNGALRYDQFKITATEHPIIKTVTGVKATKRSKTSMTLKWNTQPNASKYQVQYRVKGNNWKSKTLTKNSLALKKLKKNTGYQVRVRAYCKNGYGLANDKKASWSKWSTVKTIKTKK